MAGLRAAGGRAFADIDLLVPRAKLPEVEARLRTAGWQSEVVSDYDERYYREWMHEIPPFRHPERQIEVDLHHTLAPLTGAIKVDAAPLFAAAAAVPGRAFRIPAPADLVLLSAVHLFYGGEFAHGFRDLSDIDLLMREFAATDSGFWDALLERADRLAMGRPLCYALRYNRRLLGTPIPDEVLARSASELPGRAVLAAMDAIFEPALMPGRLVRPDGRTATARGLLWLRSHGLKMPPGLLVYHAAQKAVQTRQ